ARRLSDAELFGLFGEPLRLPQIESAYEDVARVLIRDFGIDEIFQATGRTPSQRTGDSRPGPARDRGAPSRGMRGKTLARSDDVAPLPKVSIVILTALGATHLPECLASLRRQTYPPDRVEVIVVDN